MGLLVGSAKWCFGGLFTGKGPRGERGRTTARMSSPRPLSSSSQAPTRLGTAFLLISYDSNSQRGAAEPAAAAMSGSCQQCFRECGLAVHHGLPQSGMVGQGHQDALPLGILGKTLMEVSRAVRRSSRPLTPFHLPRLVRDVPGADPTRHHRMNLEHCVPSPVSGISERGGPDASWPDTLCTLHIHLLSGDKAPVWSLAEIKSNHRGLIREYSLIAVNGLSGKFLHAKIATKSG